MRTREVDASLTSLFKFSFRHPGAFVRLPRNSPKGSFLIKLRFAMAAVIFPLCCSSAAGADQRPWDAKDSAQLGEFTGLPNMMSDGDDPSRLIAFSPNGAYFYIIYKAGDLQSDKVTYILRIFDFRAIARQLAQSSKQNVAVAGKSFLVSEFRSEFFDRRKGWGVQGLSNVRWQDDSSALLFRMSPRDDEWNAFRLEVGKNQVEKLTDTGGLDWFDYEHGSTVFGAGGPRSTDALADPPLPPRYPMEPLNGLPQGRVAFTDLASGAGRPPPRIFIKSGENTREIGLQTIGTDIDEVKLAPDGRKFVVHRSNDNTFDLFEVSDDLTIRKTASFRGYGLSQAGRIYWTADSLGIVLLGAHRARDPQEAPGCVLSVNLARGGASCLYAVSSTSTINSQFHAISDLTRGRLVLRSPMETDLDGRLATFAYNPLAKRWGSADPIDPSSKIREDIKIEFAESENRPPALVARGGGGQITLLSPLRFSARLAEWRQFLWTDSEGRSERAGLLLPPERAKGPIPIVIEHYTYDPAHFLPDGGPDPTDAAQALVARGIGVLTMTTVDDLQTPSALVDGKSRDWTEGADVSRRIESAIDALVERGLADPKRIGLAGFSRSGYETSYILSHPNRTRFAAAVIGDAFPGSYSFYLEKGALGLPLNAYMAIGRTFWDDPDYWLSLETTFNADRVVTPALFTSNLGMDAELPFYSYESEDFQTIGSYLINRKPIEFLYFRLAGHNMARPLERAEMKQDVVDWMAFWLSGEENPRPDRAELMGRWREIESRWLSTEKGDGRSVDGYITLRSGLKYRIETRKSGRPPSVGDSVALKYAVGSTGRAFSPEMTAILTVPNWANKDDILATRSIAPIGVLGLGWCQILRLVHEGERATLMMPATLATGIKGIDQLPSGAMLKIEIEVTAVRRAPG
jgi:hypothetical protein